MLKIRFTIGEINLKTIKDFGYKLTKTLLIYIYIYIKGDFVNFQNILLKFITSTWLIKYIGHHNLPIKIKVTSNLT
jgi:hypothetical protein